MKKYLLSLTLILIGCSTTVSQPTYSNYKVGQQYTLKKTLFLFVIDKHDSSCIPNLAEPGYGGTTTDIQKLNTSDPQVKGVLSPGDIIEVTKIKRSYNIENGWSIDILGKIVKSKEPKLKILLNLSSEGWPSVANINTNLLQ